MLPIRWNARALDKLDELIAYIAERNLMAAEQLQDRIETAVLPASEHPYMFASGAYPVLARSLRTPITSLSTACCLTGYRYSTCCMRISSIHSRRPLFGVLINFCRNHDQHHPYLSHAKKFNPFRLHAKQDRHWLPRHLPHLRRFPRKRLK
jgi:plasmid stabilization system protein ParE